MKYPNDFLANRSSPTAQGRKDSHVVSGEFSQRRVGSTVTKKKGAFKETKTLEESKPTVAIWYYKIDNTINLALIDLEGRTTIKAVSFVRHPKLSTNAPSLHNGRIILIAPNRFIALFGDANTVGLDITGPDVQTWPAVMRLDGPVKQYTESEDSSLGTTISYIESIVTTGLPEYDHNNEPHALGWDGTSYRFGFSCTYPADLTTTETRYKTRAPLYWTGNTEDYTMTQVAVPYYPGREHPGFSAYTIGPGRLQALMVVAEDRDLTQLPPYFANTSDYGSTWSSSSASVLAPYLYQHPMMAPTPEGDPGYRAYYDDVQLAGLSKYTLNVYVGDGKNIFVIPNGMYENVSDTPKYCAMAFIGTEGSGYTRLSWPPDAWQVDADGSGATNFAGMTYYAQDHRNAQMCFGLGCFYMLVTHENARKWLITRDFGATWTIQARPASPGGLTGGNVGNYGTVVSPYVNAESPGVILFAYYNLAGGRIDIVKTDGLFQEFKTTKGVLEVEPALSTSSPMLYDPAGAFNQYPTSFVRPFPVFPAEFGRT